LGAKLAFKFLSKRYLKLIEFFIFCVFVGNFLNVFLTQTGFLPAFSILHAKSIAPKSWVLTGFAPSPGYANAQKAR